MRDSLEEARAALAKAKDDMAQFYNQCHSPTPQYKVGDRVYLDSSDISTTRPSKKLAHRFLGPFPIVKCVGMHAYHLCLPASMSRLHPVFHVIKLLPAPPDPFPGRHSHPPPPPTVIEGEPQYEVESILDSHLRRGKLQYLVHWKGYGYEENSWVEESDVNAPRLIKEFHRRHTAAPRRIQVTDFGRIRFRMHRGDAS